MATNPENRSPEMTTQTRTATLTFTELNLLIEATAEKARRQRNGYRRGIFEALRDKLTDIRCGREPGTGPKDRLIGVIETEDPFGNRSRLTIRGKATGEITYQLAGRGGTPESLANLQSPAFPTCDQGNDEVLLVETCQRIDAGTSRALKVERPGQSDLHLADAWAPRASR